jgi:predicted RNase H-like nuclease
MHYYKRKPAGFSERLRLLEVYYPNAADVIVAVNLPGVARDDVVDALSAAVTAYRSEGNLQRIPETPQYDLTGLPIEMVFWDGEM